MSVKHYETVTIGGAIYVRLSDEADNGWIETLNQLEKDFVISPGITMHLSASMEEVIENGFDQLHFNTVHQLKVSPFNVTQATSGAMLVKSVFQVPAHSGNAATTVDYTATAISPGLILVQLSGDEPYAIITGAIPTGPFKTTARLSFALPKSVAASDTYETRHDALKIYSHRGLSDDDAVWKHVNRACPPQWTEDDAPIKKFYNFCGQFQGTPQSNK